MFFAKIRAKFGPQPRHAQTAGAQGRLWPFGARERREARQQADLERSRLEALLLQMPVCVGVTRGPGHVFSLMNPPMARLYGNRPVLGQSVRSALPEHAASGVFDILDHVFRSGETFRADELPVEFRDPESNEQVTRYLNFVHQPVLGVRGQIEGIITTGIDVTEQVLARRKLEQHAQTVTSDRAWLERVLDLTPVPLIFIEPGTTRIILSNRAARELGNGEFVRSRDIAELNETLHCCDPTGRAVPFDELPGSRVARGEKCEPQELTWVCPRVHLPGLPMPA